MLFLMLTLCFTFGFFVKSSDITFCARLTSCILFRLSCIPVYISCYQSDFKALMYILLRLILSILQSILIYPAFYAHPVIYLLPCALHLSMHLNIAVRLRDLDAHGKINRETIHLCENMLPYHARY